MDLNAKHFKVAFSVQALSGNTPTPANNPDFVEWVAIMMNLEAEAEKYTTIGVHKCNEEDYAEFHPI